MHNRLRINFFCFSLALTAIIITPWISYDPLNLPKQLSLVILAGILVSTLGKSELKQIFNRNKLFNTLIALFVLQLTLVLFFAPGNFYQQFYGASGRQTGLLTYLSLAIIIIITSNLCSHYLIKSIVKTLMIVGLLSVGYGILQSFNLDPINWTTPHSPIFGYLGNPNFFSSFLGISMAPTFVYALKSRFLGLQSYISFAYIFISFYLIYRTGSKQGFLVAGIVLASVIVLYILKQISSNLLKLFVVGASFLVFVTSMLDILQKTPWNPFLYESSVSFRGDFWRAAIQMGLSHPFFGVGIDSYRDYYFRSRDLVASQRGIAEASVDSAHNVILDMLSNGGFPLAIIYLLITGSILASAIRVFRRITKFDPMFVTLFTVWIGFQAQSIISINVIGLSVWGWVFGGLIKGYDSLTDKNKSIANTQHKVIIKTDINKVFRVLLGFVLGFVIVFPAFKADMNFRTAIDLRSIDLIRESAYIFPQSVVRMNYVSRTFKLNGLNDLSLDIARDAVIFSPETFESWKLIYELPNSSTSEKEEAYRRITYLNPTYFIGK